MAFFKEKKLDLSERLFLKYWTQNLIKEETTKIKKNTFSNDTSLTGEPGSIVSVGASLGRANRCPPWQEANG
jgi:hypothetical protein